MTKVTAPILEDIHLFDTTLRDGQQCPGAGMEFSENLAYAELTVAAGIDVLEIGFPAAGQEDFNIVHEISSQYSSPNSHTTFAALAQLRQAQVETTIKALEPAKAFKQARVHLYLPVSPYLMKSSLGSMANKTNILLQDVYKMVKLAFDAGMEVEFSPEGYSQQGDNFNFTTEVIFAAIEAGASIINCPDTIGGACELQGDNYFVAQMNKHAALVRERFPERNIRWSAHCHNDFGLALSNSMQAVFKGPARQVEGCFNGVGERAGNVALEQVVMYIDQFGQLPNLKQAFNCRFNKKYLQEISNFLSDKMLPRQPHWPITGDNAARHTSGGHTNAILNDPLAYQPFDPRLIGKSISFVFGPLSGGNHAKNIIEKYGYRCDDHEKAKIAQFIKDFYSDRRKGITDKELVNSYLIYRKPIKINDLDYKKDSKGIKLSFNGVLFDKTGTINLSYQNQGSVMSAIFHEIQNNIADLSIAHYESKALGKGINAKSESIVQVKDSENNRSEAKFQDYDIELSGLYALVEAVNNYYIDKHFRLGSSGLKNQNIIDKIWQLHVVKQQKNHPAILAIDFMLLHEVTSAQAFSTLKKIGLNVFDSHRLLATMDHSIPTTSNRAIFTDKIAQKQVETLEKNVKQHGIPIKDLNSDEQGIVHVIGPELGITQPGMTIVCGDSHTSTHGAFGALAFGVGTSVVGHVLASGAMLMHKPKVMKVEFKGLPPSYVSAKDIILKLIQQIGTHGGTGFVLEYTGDVIKQASMEERMTLCNMSIECGAVAGLISPDNVTYDYLKGRQYAPSDSQWQEAISYWDSLKSDSDAVYDKTVTVDLNNMNSLVTWGTNPSQSVNVDGVVPALPIESSEKALHIQQALDYMGLNPGDKLEGLSIQWAFIGSCTNGRIEDLRIAANILKGHHIAKGVTMYVVPGSMAVYHQAQKEGLEDVFTAAGADFRMPGCSMCIGMNGDQVPPGERVVSSTNRNFVGRQGPGSRTHLASPATVAASALAGHLVSPKNYINNEVCNESI